MKINHNCVRDLLLFLEAQQTVETDPDGDLCLTETLLWDICQGLPHYSQEDIFYTLSRMREGGYIDMSVKYASNTVSFCAVNYITYAGHEFLEKIRPGGVWEKTTGAIGKLGCYSLQILEKIAEGVATAYINHALSL